MGSELIQLLEQEARVEKDKVIDDARTRAEELLAGARKDAEEILLSTRRRLENERAQARTRAASAASLRAAALMLEAKDAAIQRVFERATTELRRVGEDPARRRAILGRLIEEAAQGVVAQGATLEVPPGDAEAAKDVCRRLRLPLQIRETPDLVGGVRLTTEDRRIAVENTVASRLARTRSILVSRVAEVLWGR